MLANFENNAVMNEKCVSLTVKYDNDSERKKINDYISLKAHHHIISQGRRNFGPQLCIFFVAFGATKIPEAKFICSWKVVSVNKFSDSLI